MKKQKKAESTQQLAPRFKQGAGTASWKLAAALVLALAVGVGSAIAMNQSKQKPILTDYELGLDIEQPAQDAEG